MATQDVYLTAEGIAKLREEYEYLTTTGREQVAMRLGTAADDGDLSENAAYDAAKEEQATLEGRIAELKKVLSKAVPIEAAGGADTSRVRIGSKVTAVDEEEEEETYMIVSPLEAAPLAGRISHESPVGRALLDKVVGNEIKIDVPAGTRTLRIVRIA
ncbi:MAG: transcription elongation factor GreA [Chloroflexota bacterium]